MASATSATSATREEERRPRTKTRWRLGLTLGVIVGALSIPAWPRQTLAAESYPEASCTTADDEAASREAFLAGKKAYDVADYERAVDEFVLAYAKDCRQHGFLPILSGALEKQGSYEKAIDALRTYLERSPQAEDREAIRTKLKNLEKRVEDARLAKLKAVEQTSRVHVPTADLPTTRVPELEVRGHSLAPWVVVSVGGAAVVVAAILFPLGVASNDGVIARDALGNPAFENGIPVIQRCSTFGGECTAYVGDPSHPTTNPRYAISDQAAKERTHPATQAALAARDKSIAGLVVGGMGLLCVGIGLLWHYTEPTGRFASPDSVPTRTDVRAILRSASPMLAPGLAGLGMAGRF